MIWVIETSERNGDLYGYNNLVLGFRKIARSHKQRGRRWFGLMCRPGFKFKLGVFLATVTGVLV